MKNQSDATAQRTDVCWVCKSLDLKLLKRGNLPSDLDATSFRITDFAYGRTADIYGCNACGFRMCPDVDDVLPFYESMSDDGYQDTREQRALQARKLVRQIKKFKPSGRLLDVGAGSGILVEASMDEGYEAVGVEPSRSLQKEAADRNLPVHLGVLGEAEITPPFDAACLIDVIEHVPNPVELLKQIADQLDEGGVLLVVTPDVSSVAARGLKWKWWHYRVAHIGYFNRQTLETALRAAGFDILSVTRPTWYFPASYLAERLSSYLPKLLRIRLPGVLGRVTVPLNLFDSLSVIVRKSTNSVGGVKDGQP